jgi:replication factor C subunit 3/5
MTAISQSQKPWIEKYRPTHFDDIVLDPINRRLFYNVLNSSTFPHLLFYGPPGTGKTTTIINLIQEYQSKRNIKNSGNIIHLNASDERGIDIIRNQIQQFVLTKNLFDIGLKFVVLDEVDYMTKNAQQALKELLLSTCMQNVRFCLICNYISKIDSSLQNEFICIRFNQLPKVDIFRFIRNVADNEKLNLTESTIEKIYQLYGSDIRSMINFLQSGWSREEEKLLPPLHHLVFLELNELFLAKSLPVVIRDFVLKMCRDFNCDCRQIFRNYFDFVLRSSTNDLMLKNNDALCDFLDKMEKIVHHQDSIPLDVLLSFFCHL